MTAFRIGFAILLSLAACVVSTATPPASSTDTKPPTQPTTDAQPPADETPPSPDASAQPPADASALDIPHDMPPLDSACETRRDFALNMVGDALAFASAGCSIDADCVQVSRSTGCRGSCPAAVLATHADAYEALRGTVADRVCSTYREDGCPYATPRCMGGEPMCIEGTCEIARAD